MIDPRTPTLRARATLWEGPSAERVAALGQRKSDSASFAAQDLGVDRRALTQFAVVQVVLFAVYLISPPSGRDGEWGFVNGGAGPFVLLLSCLWTGYKIVIANPRTIWTPMPWVLLVSAMYFGFAPMLFTCSNEDTIVYTFIFWEIGPYDLWRTNILNTVALLTIVTAFLAADKLLKTGGSMDRTAPQTVADSDDRARTAALVFLGIGLPVRYLLVLPYEFGQWDIKLPGSLIMLNYLIHITLFMLAYLATRRGGLWTAGFWLLFVVEAFMGLANFSKQEIFLVFIMSALGRFQARRNVKELVFFAIVIFVAYLPLSSMVAWGRLRIVGETGYLWKAPLNLRLAVAAEALERALAGNLKHEGYEHLAGAYKWWGRLCYANSEAACMHLYDKGAVGDTFSIALYNWIPRIIWPDKPVITPGEDFTELIQGVRGNNTAPGFVAAEAYWNGGWPMVILACGYLGVMFAWISRNILGILARSEWLLLPCAFMGIMMGYRIDYWFATTYAVGFIMYLFYYYLIRFALGFAQNRD